MKPHRIPLKNILFYPLFQRTKSLVVSALLFASAAIPLRAEMAGSKPEGFSKITIPAARSETVPSLTTLSLTLSNPVVYAGAWSAIDGINGKLTDANALWTNGELSGASTPYYVKITSGAGVGRIFKISANTTNTLTVDLGTPAVNLTEVGAGLVMGDQYEIFAADTLGSLFGTENVPLKSGAAEATADLVKVWSDQSQAWVTFFHNGTEWRKVLGGTVSQNNTVLPLDRGIQIVRRETSSLNLIFTGTVVTGMHRTPLGQSIAGSVGKNFISTPFVKNIIPVTLATSGLDQMPGWIKNASPELADQVQVYSETSQAWFTYFHNGTEWRKILGGTISQNATVLEEGRPMMVIRRSSPTGANALYAQSSSYEF
ncbi:MAG: TIGR02597 family protein [Verrucomicrobiota bacterium]